MSRNIQSPTRHRGRLTGQAVVTRRGIEANEEGDEDEEEDKDEDEEEDDEGVVAKDGERGIEEPMERELEGLALDDD